MEYRNEYTRLESIPVEQRPADELIQLVALYVELRSKREMIQAEVIEMDRRIEEADKRINILIRDGGKTDERINVIKNAALHVWNNSLAEASMANVPFKVEDIEELKARLF